MAEPTTESVTFARELRGSDGTSGGALVTLTPEAQVRAIERGLPARTIDDIVDRRSLFLDTDDYLRWQHAWFRRLSAATSAPDAAEAARQLLKVPLDSVVVWARLLAGVVDRLRPRDLVYVGPARRVDPSPWHNGHLQFWPQLGDEPLAPRLLSLVADQRGIGLRLSETETAATPTPVDRRHPRSFDRMLAIARRRLGPVRNLGLAGTRTTPTSGSTLLLWSGGYGARAVADAARANRSRVVVLERGESTGVLVLGPSGYRRTGAAIDAQPSHDDAIVPDALDDLLREVDEWTGVPGSWWLLRSRAEFFTGQFVPAVDRVADALGPALEQEHVTTIAAANPSSIEEFGALVAGQRAGVERILHQHGDHLFRYDAWLLTETHNFTELRSSDPTIPGDLAADSQRLGIPAPVVRMGQHRQTTERLHHRAARHPTVHYVPGSYVGDTAILPLVYGDDAWYATWRVALLGLMRRRPEHFVWKGLPHADQAPDPLPPRFGRGNVRFDATPLPRLLPKLERAIVDFASTALFEMADAGVPTLALWFPGFGDLRPAAAELFAPILRRAETTDEGLEIVQMFLDDDPARWCMPSGFLGTAVRRDGA